jgi:hypothetical protein
LVSNDAPFHGHILPGIKVHCGSSELTGLGLIARPEKLCDRTFKDSSVYKVKTGCSPEASEISTFQFVITSSFKLQPVVLKVTAMNSKKPTNQFRRSSVIGLLLSLLFLCSGCQPESNESTKTKMSRTSSPCPPDKPMCPADGLCKPVEECPFKKMVK